MNTLIAVPTPTHMALVELQDRGVLKYLVSQNCDGLHRRSGIASVSYHKYTDANSNQANQFCSKSKDRISELHGNSNREYCIDCGKEYIRGTYHISTIPTIFALIDRFPSGRYLRTLRCRSSHWTQMYSLRRRTP